MSEVSIDVNAEGVVVAINNVAITTRADLMKLPQFSHLKTDSSGNPCVWRNHYAAQNGRTGQFDEWSSDWSCQCDDDGIEPTESVWVGPEDETLREAWEWLPDHD